MTSLQITQDYNVRLKINLCLCVPVVHCRHGDMNMMESAAIIYTSDTDPTTVMSLPLTLMVMNDSKQSKMKTNTHTHTHGCCVSML